MRIKRIVVENFLGKGNVVLKLDQYQAIIGLNGSGKSLLLNMIASVLSGEVPHPVLYDSITINLEDSQRTLLTLGVKEDFYSCYEDSADPFFLAPKEVPHSLLGEEGLTDPWLRIDSLHISAMLDFCGIEYPLSRGGYRLVRMLDAVRNNNIVLIDEAENSLHLGVQELLWRCFRTINPKAQVILTTHSPDVIVEAPIYCLTSRKPSA